MTRMLQFIVSLVEVIRSVCQTPTTAELEADRMSRMEAERQSIPVPVPPRIELADLEIFVAARPRLTPWAQLYFSCKLTCPCGHSWNLEVWQLELPCLHVPPCAVCGTSHAQELHENLAAVETLEMRRSRKIAARN